MLFSDYQKRLWLRMIKCIDDYLQSKTTNFFSTVGELEAALDASEITDKLIINDFYTFWTPLEVRRALNGNDVNLEEVKNELIEMKNFLLKIKAEFNINSELDYYS